MKLWMFNLRDCLGGLFGNWGKPHFPVPKKPWETDGENGRDSGRKEKILAG